MLVFPYVTRAVYGSADTGRKFELRSIENRQLFQHLWAGNDQGICPFWLGILNVLYLPSMLVRFESWFGSAESGNDIRVSA